MSKGFGERLLWDVAIDQAQETDDGPKSEDAALFLLEVKIQEKHQ